ncbi:GNAT family N-acetyltransferase [Croceicoccus ponticola]|uniref:GNAT family N-acetyltransferase n=1 Tax=Croceicoccus ponticola TaxID=2217664 RepID=A0A437GX51_9SPHN|nr:GNAT family N-acetyltransferase [Croceicoccus ponticola]RVQ66972.1 GNAT family N-acetyltransferase [Croceicoccus ponticola]
MRLIREAVSDADRNAFAANCREFIDWCRNRYSDRTDLIEAYFVPRDAATELAEIAATYRPPEGRIFLLEQDGAVVGGGAYRRFDERSCELKRIYVSAAGRGKGAGRALTERLVAAATADGFTRVMLETGDRQDEAIALYRSMGFLRIEPYRAHPENLVPHLVSMVKCPNPN